MHCRSRTAIGCRVSTMGSWFDGTIMIFLRFHPPYLQRHSNLCKRAGGRARKKERKRQVGTPLCLIKKGKQKKDAVRQTCCTPKYSVQPFTSDLCDLVNVPPRSASFAAPPRFHPRPPLDITGRPARSIHVDQKFYSKRSRAGGTHAQPRQ